jgi:hypothetical protein
MGPGGLPIADIACQRSKQLRNVINAGARELDPESPSRLILRPGIDPHSAV